VVSLCGSLNGTAYSDCINYAATFYKCQENEPCLNMSYVQSTGTFSGTSGYGVARGWDYEFGCYFDVNLASQPAFTSLYNPCQVFDPTESRQDTVMALLGFLEGLPAIYDQNQAEAGALFNRSVSTYQFIKTNYPGFAASDNDTGFWGTSLLLLYDYSGNSSYLSEAVGLNSRVPQSSFNFWGTDGDQFYWEEYVHHKDAILAANLTYNVSGQDPINFFVNQMYYNYKNAGTDKSIGTNAERVLTYYKDYQFQNSRAMLAAGVFASRATELANISRSDPTLGFIPLIADSQLAWLTGMNGVLNGTGTNATLTSYSFIFGIGHNPSQFHSRWLVNTGYSALSGGQVIGARGTSLQFFNATDYVYLDGVANIPTRRS
jgi:hypothetical protein